MTDLLFIHAGLPGPGPLHSRGGGRITGQSLGKGSWVSRSVCSLNLNQEWSESPSRCGASSTCFGYYVTNAKGCRVGEDNELRVPGVQKHHSIMLTGMLDSLPPAALQRRAADSKQLPVCVATWSSLWFHINFSVLWIWSHMRHFSFLLIESSLFFWIHSWVYHEKCNKNPIFRCPVSKPTSFILIYSENDAASSETLYVNHINSNPAIVCNECETHSWLLMMSIKWSNLPCFICSSVYTCS